MAQIQAKNLSFRYDGGEDVFTDMSFSIDTDWEAGACREKRKRKDNAFKAFYGGIRIRGQDFVLRAFEYFHIMFRILIKIP